MLADRTNICRRANKGEWAFGGEVVINQERSSGAAWFMRIAGAEGTGGVGGSGVVMANIRAWFARAEHSAHAPLCFAHQSLPHRESPAHDLPAAEHAQGMPSPRTRESLPPVLRTILLLAVIGVALAAASAGLLALIGPVR